MQREYLNKLSCYFQHGILTSIEFFPLEISWGWLNLFSTNKALPLAWTISSNNQVKLFIPKLKPNLKSNKQTTKKVIQSVWYKKSKTKDQSVSKLAYTLYPIGQLDGPRSYSHVIPKIFPTCICKNLNHVTSSSSS
jgi:hypothetical protein